MGHVGEPPAVCDFADGSMSLIRIFKGVSAAFKPPRLNEAHDGRIVICKDGVGISHADSHGISDRLRAKGWIAQSCFDNRTNI
jgi:hypothetical protein